MKARRRPEVLAPVGSPDCLPAAVAGGADAVFLGLRHFNARGRAENFRKAELAHHVAYLHHHHVKCYVVMNTLVHDDEYPKALDLAAAAHAANVDAVIIQDLGLWRALARELPGLKRHASTQMTIHHPSQVAVLAALGAERVILARELSLAEVAACTREAERLGIETEHFVHGALCYAFSGQCLMSNFAGCRSANRGTCAQNCRFDYTSSESGVRGPESVDPGPRTPDSGRIETEISMKDFSLIARIGELADTGVASLKIEGRLKGADYVYTTSRVYRAATEAWAAGKKFDPTWARELLKDVFARAQTEAPLDGVYGSASRLHRYEPEQDRAPDATLVSADRRRGEVVVQSRVPITAGQGFSFSVGFFNGGFLVIGADALGGDRWRLKVRIAEHGPRLPAETPLFRNANHERKREAATAMAEVPVQVVAEPTIALALQVSAHVGAPLSVSARAADGRSVEVASDTALTVATGRPADETLMREKLGAFGGTPWHLGELVVSTDGRAFAPASLLKDLRRRLVDGLAALPAPTIAPTWTPPEPGTPRRRTTAVWVAVGSIAAGEAALAHGASAVWLDDPTIDWWGTSAPAMPAPDARWWLRQAATAPVSPHLARCGWGVVAGHLGVLAAARTAGLPAIADLFCNTYSTETLLSLRDLGAQAAVISLECSGREIARLAARCATLADAGVAVPALALIAHGRLPAMLTRQDHGLAVGATRTITAVARDGGLPYDLQRRRHGDTVVWEGRRLCAPEHVAPTAGLVDAWVLELADLEPAQVAEMTAAYVALAGGGGDAATITALAAARSPHGLFTGHLAQGSRELDLVVERMEAGETVG
ncbi:MAG: U32 family peptidase [Planctomycetes bacterium]|nr:U32 family peptidase [Planctomycetota bacterium]